MNTDETIMEGQMHEHGPLYASVAFVMFDEGVWLVVWCVEVLCCVWCVSVCLCVCEEDEKDG